MTLDQLLPGYMHSWNTFWSGDQNALRNVDVIAGRASIVKVEV